MVASTHKILQRTGKIAGRWNPMTQRSLLATGRYLSVVCSALALQHCCATAQEPDSPGSPTVSTTRPVYEVGESVIIEYSGLAGRPNVDWIAIARASDPPDERKSFTWVDGSSGRIVSKGRGLDPGKYEVRLFLNWPEGGYQKVAASAFEIVASSPEVRSPEFRFIAFESPDISIATPLDSVSLSEPFRIEAIFPASMNPEEDFIDILLKSPHEPRVPSGQCSVLCGIFERQLIVLQLSLQADRVFGC